jgi:hypothetical protein
MFSEELLLLFPVECVVRVDGSTWIVNAEDHNNKRVIQRIMRLCHVYSIDFEILVFNDAVGGAAKLQQLLVKRGCVIKPKRGLDARAREFMVETPGKRVFRANVGGLFFYFTIANLTPRYFGHYVVPKNTALKAPKSALSPSKMGSIGAFRSTISRSPRHLGEKKTKEVKT